MAFEGQTAPSAPASAPINNQMAGTPAPLNGDFDMSKIIASLDEIDANGPADDVNGEPVLKEPESVANKEELDDDALDIEREKFKLKKEFGDRSKRLESKIQEQQQMIDQLMSMVKGEKKPEQAEQKEQTWDELLETSMKGNKETFSKEEVAAMIKEQIDTLKQENQRELSTKELSSMENKHKGEIGDFITKNSEQFPLTHSMGQSEAVFDLIVSKWDRDVEGYGEEYATKNVLNYDRASKLVEDHLASQMKNMLQSTSAKKYLQGLLGQQQTSKQTTTTLSNSMTSPNGSQELSEDDRMELAMRALDGMGYGNE